MIKQIIMSVLTILSVGLPLQIFSSVASACSESHATQEFSEPVRETVQKSSVRFVSILDPDGKPTSLETGAPLPDFNAIRRAHVVKEPIQIGGKTVVQTVVELESKCCGIVKYYGDASLGDLAILTSDAPGAHSATAMTEFGKIVKMMISIKNSRKVNVLLLFEELTEETPPSAEQL